MRDSSPVENPAPLVEDPVTLVGSFLWARCLDCNEDDTEDDEEDAEEQLTAVKRTTFPGGRHIGSKNSLEL